MRICSPNFLIWDRLTNATEAVLLNNANDANRRIKYGADRINWDFTPSSLGNVEHFRVMSALARS